jgi:hypothetical protein
MYGCYYLAKALALEMRAVFWAVGGGIYQSPYSLRLLLIVHGCLLSLLTAF